MANDFYGFLFNEQQSYEEMVEIIANTLIRTELSLETNDAKYIENPKIAYRRSELFHLWSKHDFIAVILKNGPSNFLNNIGNKLP